MCATALLRTQWAILEARNLVRDMFAGHAVVRITIYRIVRPPKHGQKVNAPRRNLLLVSIILLMGDTWILTTL